MKQHVCSYAGARDEQIVGYLYDEAPLEERASFERHLRSCVLCRSEVDVLRGVRAELGKWASPEPDFAVTVDERAKVVPASRQMSSWAQAVAATLLVGVGAGAANLDINYSSAQGLAVRTGWRHAAEDQVQTTVASPAVTSPQPSWKSELIALEARLREEMAAHPVAAPLPLSPPVGDDAALRRVRALLNDSEQRQTRELALRFAEMAREVEFQRQSDLAKIDRNLGMIQSRTGMEVMRTQQQVNSLAQRVSQRP
jgi:hypothetical protein